MHIPGNAKVSRRDKRTPNAGNANGVVLMDQPIGSIDCSCGILYQIPLKLLGRLILKFRKKGVYEGRRPGVQQSSATDQLPAMTKPRSSLLSALIDTETTDLPGGCS